MNNQSVIVSKVAYSNNFEIVYKLVSYENAQKEFDRDCEAFDVHLFADVNYNGRSLLDEVAIMGGDYNWNESASDLLEVLIDYVNIEELVDKAENERLEMIKDLQK